MNGVRGTTFGTAVLMWRCTRPALGAVLAAGVLVAAVCARFDTGLTAPAARRRGAKEPVFAQGMAAPLGRSRQQSGHGAVRHVQPRAVDKAFEPGATPRSGVAGFPAAVAVTEPSPRRQAERSAVLLEGLARTLAQDLTALPQDSPRRQAVAFRLQRAERRWRLLADAEGEGQ